MVKKDWGLKKSLLILLAIVLLYVGYCLVYAFNENRNEAQRAVTHPPVCQVDAAKLLEYINGERSRLGAPALAIDSTLATAAKYKLDNLVTERYFAHKMANGSAWDKYTRDLGVKAAIAENIGSNDNTPEQSWTEFKNSPSHYSSLIDPQYTRIGIAAQCTDYKLEKAVEPGDEQHVGTKITDLTVVSLAAPEPPSPAQQPTPAPQVQNTYVQPSYRPSYTSCTHHDYTYFNDDISCTTY